MSTDKTVEMYSEWTTEKNTTTQIRTNYRTSRDSQVLQSENRENTEGYIVIQ